MCFKDLLDQFEEPRHVSNRSNQRMILLDFLDLTAEVIDPCSYLFRCKRIICIYLMGTTETTNIRIFFTNQSDQRQTVLCAKMK